MTIQEHISRIKARGFVYKEDKEVAIRSLEAWEKVKAEIKTPMVPTKNKDYEKGWEDAKLWMLSVINRYMAERSGEE